MPEHSLALREQFDDALQQQETSRLAMWLFLATEVMFFGDLFMSYTVYHLIYGASFGLGARQTNLLLGSINTVILLTSGLTMALAVNAIQRGKVQSCVRFILITMALAVGFMVVKGFEYADDIHKNLVPGPNFSAPGRPASEIFFWLYWIMTGVHGLHVIVGIGILAVMAYWTRRNRFDEAYHTPVEVAALYWGFVDVIWIFLYPLLYLIDRHGHV